MPKKFKPASGSVVSSPLSPNNLTALRRCRPLLVKDLDVDELLRNAASVTDSVGTNSDNVGCGSRFMGPEVRSSVLSIPDAERRAIALLDAIESPTCGGTTTGRVDADAAFAGFLDALRVGDRNRKLYAVLEETLRVLSYEQNGSEDDGDGDDCGLFVDRTSVPGESVRRLLRRYTTKQSASFPQNVGRATTSGDSKSDLRSPDVAEATGGDDYVDCFTVATRGSRLQPEPWIKHAKASHGADNGVHSSSSSSSSPSSSIADNTVVVTKDLVFRRILRSSLSSVNGVALKLPPPMFNNVYVVDYDYKLAAETETGRGEIPAPPRLQSVAPAGADSALSTASGDAAGDRLSNKKTANSVFLATETNLAAAIITPPLPPKPRDLPAGDLYRSANKSACRPLPLPGVDQVVNSHDTVSSTAVEAPPLPERKRTGVPVADQQADHDDVQMPNLVPRTEEAKFSSSPVLPVRRRNANTDVAEAVDDSDTESDASGTSPPQLPPRTAAIGTRPLPLPPVASCTEGSADNDEVQSAQTEDGKSKVNLTGEEFTATVDADVKVASIAEVVTVQSPSVDEVATGDGCSTPLTSTATTIATSDSTSLTDSEDTVNSHGINRPISQREDSGIVVTVSTSSPTIVSCDDSSAGSSTTDVFVQRDSSSTFSDDERTLACNDDESSVSEGITTGSIHQVAGPIDMRSMASDSTPGGGSSSSGSTETTTTATVGLDSGVDSLLSLSRQQEGRNSGEAGNSVNGDDGDDVVCDEDDLSEIRIPAGEDCLDDDDIDRFSSESSHYEDIEQLAMDDIYLNPRRPSDSATSSLTAGRTPSSIKRRRNDAIGGSGRYSYAYGRMTTPGSSRRREEMLTELEASDRKLLSAGTTLILDPQEADFVDRATTSAEPQSDAAETETDAVIGVDGCSAKCLRNVRLVYDARCQAFYVPWNSLRSHGDPTGQRWFYPVAMTPRDATLFLRSENQPGCFVVYRPPTVAPTSGATRQQAATSGPFFYLSVGIGNGDVVHYRIDRNPRGDLSIVGHDHSFLSVVDLVTYFRRNRSGLAVRLGRPLADARRSGVDPSLLSVATRYAVNRRDLTVTSRIVRFRPTQDDFETATTNFGISDGGRFGKTYIGRYRGKFVAVSVMGRQDFADGSVESCGSCFHSSHFTSQIDEFLEPALDVVAGLRHDNVARLVGISCTERPYYVVWEYAEGGGTLADRLRGGSNDAGINCLASEDVDSLFDVCLQASSAVAYLESQHFVLHRDIAARSFFIVEGREIGIGGGSRLIKLANFDRARRVNDDDYQAPLSENVFVRWAAPEVLVESRYSTKSDVWSLGVVFWEVFSGAAVPYSSFESLEQVAVHVASASGGRLDRPTGPCPDDLWTVMRSCWRHRPADRPSPAVIYDRLRNGRSKIYAGLASLGDMLTSDFGKMSNGGIRHPAASGVTSSSTGVMAPVVVNRRNLPLPLEPKAGAAGKSPIRPENGLAYPDLPPPHAFAKDRTVSVSTAADKNSASGEKRWSSGSGSKLQQVPVTPTQNQQKLQLPSSPSWDTTSVASVAVTGRHERGNRTRHSFINRFFSGHPRKVKKMTPLNPVASATAEEDKKV